MLRRRRLRPWHVRFCNISKKAAKVFLAGPPLVKMATNEIADEEELGGAEMHSKISGVSDYLAEDELDGIRIAREIMEIVKPLLHN